jgi:hypothetical protein
MIGEITVSTVIIHRLRGRSVINFFHKLLLGLWMSAEEHTVAPSWNSLLR